MRPVPVGRRNAGRMRCAPTKNNPLIPLFIPPKVVSRDCIPDRKIFTDAVGAHRCAPVIANQPPTMNYNPDIHHRNSIRLKNYDYSRAGAYFVTICAWQRGCLFGEIVNGEMVLNEMGRIVVDEWERTPKMRSNVELDVYSIMPNHFHAIIVIHDEIVGAHCMRPGCMRPDAAANIELRTDSNDSPVNHNRAHISAPLRNPRTKKRTPFPGPDKDIKLKEQIKEASEL